MKYKTIIQIEATQDFEVARLWYRRTKVNGLSQRFSKAVKITIRNLQTHPTFYAIRYENVRVAHTDKFPYGIHFFIENDVIVIIAIMYNGRDPKVTLNRID